MSKKQPQPGERFIPYKQFYGFLIPNSLARSGLCTPVQLLIYGRMSQYSGKDGRCFVSYQKLGDELCLSRRSVTQNVKKLVDKGLIEREQRKGQSTHFHFLWHKVFDEYAVNLDKEVAQVKNNLEKEVPHLPGEGSSPGVEKEVLHEENQEENQIEETTTTAQAQVNSQAGGDSEEGRRRSPDIDSKKRSILSDEDREYVQLVVEYKDLRGEIEKTRRDLQRGIEKNLAENPASLDDVVDMKNRLARLVVEQMDREQVSSLIYRLCSDEPTPTLYAGSIPISMDYESLKSLVLSEHENAFYKIRDAVNKERNHDQATRRVDELAQSLSPREVCEMAWQEVNGDEEYRLELANVLNERYPDDFERVKEVSSLVARISSQLKIGNKGMIQRMVPFLIEQLREYEPERADQFKLQMKDMGIDIEHDYPTAPF